VLKEKTEALMTAFAAEDPADSGLISYEVLQDCLSANDMELNDQVLITLMRRYDVNKDGTVAYKDLMSI
jgi:Ca2+-binding EF-hand superfamily protein